MELKRIIGQCVPLFFLAVTFDLVGFILLLVGLCASPQFGGRWYGDFLALTGAVLMFFGLGMWVMWYAGNLGADGKSSGFARISRKLTERLSSVRSRSDTWKTEEEEEEELEKGGKNETDGEKCEEDKEKSEEDGEKCEEDKGKSEEDGGEKQEDGGKNETSAVYINEAYEPADEEE